MSNLIKRHIETDFYLKDESSQNAATDQEKKFLRPTISVGAYTSPTVSGNPGIMQIFLFDAKSSLPSTTAALPTGKASESDAYKKLNADNLPELSLGHMNSFIKEISLSRITSSEVEAVLIERSLNNSFFSLRDPIAELDYDSQKPMNPLTLPLQGSATLWGHPAWKPYKSFFLSTRIIRGRR